MNLIKNHINVLNMIVVKYMKKSPILMIVFIFCVFNTTSVLADLTYIDINGGDTNNRTDAAMVLKYLSETGGL